jgi:hypothetical protein
MKKRILTYLKYTLSCILIIIIICLGLLFYSGNSVKYKRNYSINSDSLAGEGPYIVYQKDQIRQVYFKGSKVEGYELDEKIVQDSMIEVNVNYYPDQTSFKVQLPLYKQFKPEAAVYPEPEKLLVISDIEGGFAAFRNLLIANGVMNEAYQWTYGKGHVALAGDFIDRGYFVTQVLYLIFHLEQQAEQADGKVHYILGNHEIMNMQGDHSYAVVKYAYAAALLGMQQAELYAGDKTFLSRWLSSKNTMEKIGDNLIVHAGLHPDFVTVDFNIDLINEKVRDSYANMQIRRKGEDKVQFEILYGYSKSHYWYRGYFNESLDEKVLDKLLKHITCKRIIVGHTLQSKVKTLYGGRIVAVDVQHRQEEWGSYFPEATSQALLVEQSTLYRVNLKGKKNAL